MMKRKRGGNFASNPTKKKSKRHVRKDSDDDDDYGSDEDYVLNEEDDNEEEEEEFIQGFLLPSSDEDSFEFGDKEEKKKVVRSKTKKNNSSSGIDIGRRGKSKARQAVFERVKGSNHVGDEEEAYEFDDEDEDDEDDVEFKPNEMDFFEDDEEEDLQVGTRRSNGIKSTTSRKKTKNKKQKCASVPHRNGSVRTHKVLKKPPKKKQRGLMLRSSTSSDDDFDLDYRARPQRSRKQNKTATDTRNRRNKSVVDDDSDSDFVSSGPSDIEYTVSDEEKELLKEANSFIGKPTTRTRNSSFFDRSLHLADASTCRHSRPLRLKGKDKVTTLQEDTGYQVCGICFSEEGKGIIRGTLNCCSHYFCFSCIVEWSKIESRCPLCKQRFTSISKPARSNLGVDLRNTVIQVPKRDQVYQPSEEEVRGYLDPYDGVVCMECQIGGDDSLMLLCDICDSPAHTYCVGLGREVPEGNWYCRGCNPGSSTTDPDVGLRINVEDTNPDEASVPPPSPLASPTGLGAGVSTLSGRRRIHRQIHDFLFNAGRMRIDESEVVVADSEDEQEEPPNSDHVWSQGTLRRLRRGNAGDQLLHRCSQPDDRQATPTI